MGLFVVGLEGEAHQDTAPFAGAQFGGDVPRPAQLDRQPAVTLLDLRVGDVCRGIVGYGGAHHGAVRCVEGPDGGLVHLGGRQHVHPLHPCGCRQ